MNEEYLADAAGFGKVIIEQGSEAAPQALEVFKKNADKIFENLSPAKLSAAQALQEQLELEKWYNETLRSLQTIEIDEIDKMMTDGGHTKERHFHKTNNDLIKRSKEPKVESASGFYSQRIATLAVQENIKHNAKKIVTWLTDKNSDQKTCFRYQHKYAIGKGSINKKTSIKTDLSESKLILKKDCNKPLGFFMLTAYPS